MAPSAIEWCEVDFSFNMHTFQARGHRNGFLPSRFKVDMFLEALTTYLFVHLLTFRDMHATVHRNEHCL